MSIRTSYDPSIKAALDQWRHWTVGDTNDRPSLGELLGEGSANSVYELVPIRQQVLRFAHKSHELAVNRSRREIELWKLAANEGLAPAVYYRSDGGDVVITDRLSFSDVPLEAHAELCKQIHHLGPWGHDSDSLRLRSRTAQRRIEIMARGVRNKSTIHQPGFVGTGQRITRFLPQ